MFTIIYSEKFTRDFLGFFVPRMSYDAVKAQNAELHRTFEERYDDLSAIAVAVKDRLKRLVAEGELDEDTAVWALRSVDIRKHPHVLKFSLGGAERSS